MPSELPLSETPHSSPFPSSSPPVGELPYGRTMTRLLPVLRRAFRVLNRMTVPAVRSGLGPLFGTPATGSMLVLRTVGHRSGLTREAPLGYALLDGRIVVIAGYGRATHWFRNATAHPDVEVALPGAALAGRAEEITDPELRRRAFRAVIIAEGVVGRLTVGDMEAADDDQVDRLAEGLPLLAITPTAVLPGPFDPGGTFWRYPAVAGILALGGLAVVRRRVRRR